MIATLKDERGYVYAYIEYHILDEKSQFKDFGEYCFIQTLWVHPCRRRTSFNPYINELKGLIKKVNEDKFMKNVKWVSWWNEKHDDRPTPNYPRERLAKLGEDNGKKEQFTYCNAS